ncbi:N-acetylneuraminate synthase family protein [Algihabitans albus]|uniref:N-acetylneuraminate synthase family protein n=1 Tax=Algihabitans albus TaxID=2164067 RepID=UPI001ABC997B|nr:N-acetylneuraminate synthase family protein [Algihabitans albus]
MARFSSHFEIDGRPVGEGCPVYVIAEAGVSHFGSEEKAYRLVDLAVAAKADAVKFQVFDVDEMISRELPDWKARLGPRALPYDAFARIQGYCRQRGITFFATAHDLPSLEFLASLEVPVHKVGSGEVGNWPYLKKVAELGKPLIFSTGMYHIDQVGEALDAIAETGARDVAMLHCVTLYPTPPEQAALGSIALLRERFDAVVGYSDHTRGFHIPLAAAGLGARVIEKHITLDYDVPNAQDWKVSCGPADLGRFVSELREVEAALSVRPTEPDGAQADSLIWASKSLVAAHDLPAGHVLSAGDLRSKRPGTGISPAKMDRVFGRRLNSALPADGILTWQHLAG